MNSSASWSIGLLALLLFVCGQSRGQEVALKPLAPPQSEPDSPEQIVLGRELFFDPRLSRTDRVACSTCHDPETGFSNGERFAKGVDGRQGTRNVPGLTNVVYSRSLMWDGRAATLEEQALLPIQNPAEMDLSLDALEKKLNGIGGYRGRFEQVFGGPATAARVGQALAAFERTIVSRDTPFDRHLRGDRKSLSPSAKRGLTLFLGKARCSLCHSGPELTDHRFHNIGAGDPKLSEDLGRFAVVRSMGFQPVPARDAMRGAFRTPQLRDVARTAPYMHNGRFQTLHEVVQHYNFGGVTDEANDQRDELLEVLYLSEEEVNDLVTFLTDGLTSPSNRLTRSRRRGG